jgi:hypothetical protein
MDRQTQTEMARRRRSRPENNGYEKMKAHSKKQNGMGQHHKGGESPARAVKPQQETILLHRCKYDVKLSTLFILPTPNTIILTNYGCNIYHMN